MTRSYHRLLLTGLCAAAAVVGPVVFLEDRFRAGYLLGGLAAAFLCWGLLLVTVVAEPQLHPGIQAVMGAGAAFLSWGTISLVATFDVLPHVLRHGLARFDPVWLMGGFSPLVVPVMAWWQRLRHHRPYWEGLVRALFRFSVPLFGLRLSARMLGLPKQYVWLFMFTGVMFLVLDGLGMRAELPPSPESAPHDLDTI